MDSIAHKVNSSRDIIVPVMCSIENCMKRTESSNTNGSGQDDSYASMEVDQHYIKSLEHEDPMLLHESMEGKVTPVDVLDINL